LHGIDLTRLVLVKLECEHKRGKENEDDPPYMHHCPDKFSALIEHGTSSSHNLVNILDLQSGNMSEFFTPKSYIGDP
jgi:hypothetical protein